MVLSLVLGLSLRYWALMLEDSLWLGRGSLVVGLLRKIWDTISITLAGEPVWPHG